MVLYCRSHDTFYGLACLVLPGVSLGALPVERRDFEAAMAGKYHKSPADNRDQLLPQRRTPLLGFVLSSSIGPTTFTLQSPSLPGSGCFPASTPPPTSQSSSPSSPSHQLDLLYCFEPHKIIVPCTNTQKQQSLEMLYLLCLRTK